MGKCGLSASGGWAVTPATIGGLGAGVPVASSYSAALPPCPGVIRWRDRREQIVTEGGE